MLVSDFTYDLPKELIAQDPLGDRAASRLLHLRCGAGASLPGDAAFPPELDRCELQNQTFREFPDLLRPDDLLVLNNTRVLPARLYGKRSGARAQPVGAGNPAAREFLHGKVEVLLTRQVSLEPNEWECLVRPGRRIGVGERLFFGAQDELEAEVIARGDHGERRVRFQPAENFFGLLEAIGHVPLPPYIRREDRPGDRDRYQTVYARERGSVAAPTAGLHFTPEIFGRLRERGIETAEVTLHVGLGTFQPVHAARVEDHRLHREVYHLPPETAEKVNRALEAGRRVVAVGTTTVRTLEHAAAKAGGQRVQAGGGETDLFIYPGYKFRVVGALLTNFHLPQSTLLMLVCALGGREQVLQAYEHAVQQRYRFYSYGDCMFVE